MNYLLCCFVFMAFDFFSDQSRWHDKRISTKSYSFPRHFSWLKNYKLYFFFAVVRVTRTKTYGSYNIIKDLAFFKISSQQWSVITLSMTLFLSFFCFALILGESWNSPILIRIFSVNVTKSAVFCGFSHIYWRNPYWKILFFM